MPDQTPDIGTTIQPAINQAPDITPVDIVQMTVAERLARVEWLLNVN